MSSRLNLFSLTNRDCARSGAALYGAGVTRGFRTKDIRVQDVTPYAIDVSYDADKATEGESQCPVYRAAHPSLHADISWDVLDAETRTITTHLFPAMSKLGVKKTLTFKKSGDFAIHFAYRKDGAHG